MRTISPAEGNIFYDILLKHDARTLSPGYDNPDNLNLMLDHLRSMLMDIADGGLQARESALEAVVQLIYDSDKKTESLRRFNPAKVGEQMNYTRGLAKALSVITK